MKSQAKQEHRGLAQGKQGAVPHTSSSSLANPCSQAPGSLRPLGIMAIWAGSGCHGNWRPGRCAAWQQGPRPAAPSNALGPHFPPVDRNSGQWQEPIRIHSPPSCGHPDTEIRCRTPSHPNLGCWFAGFFKRVSVSIPIHGNASPAVDPEHRRSLWEHPHHLGCSPALATWPGP